MTALGIFGLGAVLGFIAGAVVTWLLAMSVSDDPNDHGYHD